MQRCPTGRSKLYSCSHRKVRQDVSCDEQNFTHKHDGNTDLPYRLQLSVNTKDQHHLRLPIAKPGNQTQNLLTFIKVTSLHSSSEASLRHRQLLFFASSVNLVINSRFTQIKEIFEFTSPQFLHFICSSFVSHHCLHHSTYASSLHMLHHRHNTSLHHLQFLPRSLSSLYAVLSSTAFICVDLPNPPYTNYIILHSNMRITSLLSLHCLPFYSEQYTTT